MFIEPIKLIKGIEENSGLKKEINTGNAGFKSIFTDALNNYIQAEKNVDEDVYKLSVGESDDLHNLMINTQKAQISLDLVIQLRNKALDAYNEIMRMGV